MTPLDIPSARTSPPWTWCGDPGSGDFGCVFARPGANGAVVVSFDRAGRSHALTLFSGARLGDWVALYGRRFEVVTVEAGR